MSRIVDVHLADALIIDLAFENNALSSCWSLLVYVATGETNGMWDGGRSERVAEIRGQKDSQALRPPQVIYAPGVAFFDIAWNQF